MAAIDLKNATVTIQDGTSPTPESLEIKIGTGQLNYTRRKNYEYRLDRGVLDEVVEGDQVPVELSMDAVWDFITGDSTPTVTVEDAIYNEGQAAAVPWVSTDADPCSPYCTDVLVSYIPACSSVEQEDVTFGQFRADEVQHNYREGQLSIRARCNITKPTAVRSAQA